MYSLRPSLSERFPHFLSPLSKGRHLWEVWVLGQEKGPAREHSDGVSKVDRVLS